MRYFLEILYSMTSKSNAQNKKVLLKVLIVGHLNKHPQLAKKRKHVKHFKFFSLIEEIRPNLEKVKAILNGRPQESFS